MEKEKKKILIADPDSHVFELLKKDKSASLYIFETAKSGFECLSKIDSFKPDLIFMELLLPQIHGMEILRKIKSDPRTKDVGVILTTAPMMIQNYQAAIDLKCSFFWKNLTPQRPSSHFSTAFSMKSSNPILIPESFLL